MKEIAPDTEVVLELKDGGSWRLLGSVASFEPPGVVSDKTTEGRQVYVFGWRDGEGPAVWRSAAGGDVANAAVWLLHSERLDLVGDLAKAPYEMTWHPAGPGRGAARIRWRAVEVPDS